MHKTMAILQANWAFDLVDAGQKFGGKLLYKFYILFTSAITSATAGRWARSGIAPRPPRGVASISNTD